MPERRVKPVRVLGKASRNARILDIYEKILEKGKKFVWLAVEKTVGLCKDGTICDPCNKGLHGACIRKYK